MEKKYKVHVKDYDDGGTILRRIIVNEEQKKVLDYFASNGLFPEWLGLDFSETESNYADLT